MLAGGSATNDTQAILPSAGQGPYPRNDTVAVDAEMPVQVTDGSSLAEMLDPERNGWMALYAAQPGQGSRMAVYDGDNAAMRGQVL